MRLILPLLILALPLVPLAAQFPDPFDDPEFVDPLPLLERDPETVARMVFIEVEMIELPVVEASRLLREPQKSIDATDMRAEIGKLIKAGKAQSYCDGSIITRSGQRAQIEAIREKIHPVEFDPTEIPQELTGPISPDLDISTSATPTAFETRSIGMTVEVDPVLHADNQLIDLNIAPEQVEFLGWSEFGQGKSMVKQPLVHTMKVTAAVTLSHGRPTLLAVLKPHDAPDRQVFCFVRASILLAHPTIRPLLRKAPDAGRNVGIFTEFIEIDRQTLAPLLRDHLSQDHGQADALRAALDPLIAEGKRARIRHMAYLTTRTGQRAKVESIRELIYPVSGDPPEIPQDLTGPIDPEVDLVTGVGHTAFETRSVGFTLEVDPVLDPENEKIDLNIAPEEVEFIKWEEIGQGKSTWIQPLFQTNKVTTAATAMSGKPILLGVSSPDSHAGKSERRVLMFTRATHLPVHNEQ